MVIGGVFYMMCMLGFAASFWKTVKKDWAKLDAKTIMLIGAVSVLTGFVANMLYFFVLKKHDSHVVSALIYSSPVFTLLLAYFLLHEKVTPIGCIGVIMVVLGVVCIALNRRRE